MGKKYYSRKKSSNKRLPDSSVPRRGHWLTNQNAAIVLVQEERKGKKTCMYIFIARLQAAEEFRVNPSTALWSPMQVCVKLVGCCIYWISYVLNVAKA